jgi:hypothetical protein
MENNRIFLIEKTQIFLCGSSCADLPGRVFRPGDSGGCSRRAYEDDYWKIALDSFTEQLRATPNARPAVARDCTDVGRSGCV